MAAGRQNGEATSALARLDDPRIARLLGVEPGTEVWRRFRVTRARVGGALSDLCVVDPHPRVADVVANVDANPAVGEWLYRSLWHHHPGVPSDDQLTLGERGTDRLRIGMGFGLRLRRAAVPRRR